MGMCEGKQIQNSPNNAHLHNPNKQEPTQRQSPVNKLPPANSLLPPQRKTHAQTQDISPKSAATSGTAGTAGTDNTKLTLSNFDQNHLVPDDAQVQSDTLEESSETYSPRHNHHPMPAERKNNEAPRASALPTSIHALPPVRKMQPRSRTSPNLLENSNLSPNRFMPGNVPLSNPNRAVTQASSFIYPSPHRGPMTPTSPMQGMGSYRDLDRDFALAFSPSGSGGRTSKFGTRRTIPNKRREPIMSTNQKGISPHKEITPRKLSPRKPTFRPNTKKPKKEHKFLHAILSKSPLFKGIDGDDVINSAIDETILEMYTRDVKKGEVIIKQGDVGDAFYVVEWGEFDIIVDQEVDNGQREQVVVGAIHKGETVGESALMYSTKRNATIKATMNCRVWVMDSNQFFRIRDYIKELTNKKLKANQSFLSKIPLFSKMKQHELMNLTQACREVRYKPGQVLVDKKSRPDQDLFIIREGKAWVVRDRRNSIAICQHEEIEEGDFFMRKMLNQDPLSQVKATSQMQCLKISKDDFDMLVAPYLNEGDEAKSEDESEPSTSGEVEEKSLPKDMKNRVPYTMEDFKPITLLGVGSFGHVVLVKVQKEDDKAEANEDSSDADADADAEKDSTKKTVAKKTEVYALKVVEKNKAINTGQSEHMKNERRVMFLLDSAFIVKLYATYKDETCVYFLLESVLGGELFSLLRRQLTFNEPTTRFYLACVILAFEHMHGHNVIYRDLKPENLLIDKEGYVKLTDFGFAKLRNQTTSLCGTPDYLAPELIQGLVQNFGVDWWCVGVFLFEMLVGRVPFRDTETMKMYEHILHTRPQIPTYVNWEAQDLVHKLLQKNTYKRLGSGPKGAKDVKAHGWFGKNFKGLGALSFSWDKLIARTNPAPYVPELESEVDAHLFDVQQAPMQETQLHDSLRDDPSVYGWCEEF